MKQFAAAFLALALLSPPQNAESTTVSQTAPPSPAADDNGGLFRPIQPELPPGMQAQRDPRILALVLPLESGGGTYAAADAFRLGCVDVLQSPGADSPAQIPDVPLQLDTYAHDGSAAHALAAYQQAIASDADFVIGPMQKNTVRAVRQAYVQAPVRTLVLQPGRAGGGYYVLTLDVGEEVAELARHLAAQGRRVIVIADGSQLSQRQRLAFAAAWEAAAGEDAAELEYVYVYDPRTDWQKLFERLKNETERAEEAKEKGETPPAPPVLFAAGDGKFIRRARNFSPQGYALYAGSVFFSHAEEARFLDNLRLLEMPWFVAAESAPVRGFARAAMRARPALQQRFYALGADACRAVRQSFLWREGWTMQGASGELQLNADGVLRRRGVPARYVAGALRPLK